MASLMKYYGALLRQSDTAPSLEEARRDYLQALLSRHLYHAAI